MINQNCQFLFSQKVSPFNENEEDRILQYTGFYIPKPWLQLFWPPGTCINNTSVMMFKKGSFEIGATVYPVAIKVTCFLFPFVRYTIV